MLSRRVLAGAIFAATLFATAAAQQPAPHVTYMEADKIAALLPEGGTLASGPDFTAALARRTAAGQVEIHANTNAQGSYFASGSLPLSAFVHASYFRWHADEIGLIVLWRGGEGWHSGSLKSGGSGNAAGYTGFEEFGSVRVDFSYDRSRRLARIQKREVSLADADNIVLVDGIDRAGGGFSAKSIRADLTLPAAARPGSVPARLSPDDIASLLRRSEEVIAFLRCDTRGDSRTPKASGFIC